MDYERLLGELEENLLKEPLNVLLMNKLAIANMENDEREEAYKLFEKASRLNPGVETLTNLGCFYLEEGKPLDNGDFDYAEEEAVDVLERTLEFNPKTDLPYSALGEAYIKLKRFSDAEKALKVAVSIKAHLSNQNNLGISQYKQNKIGKALYWFKKACEVNKEGYESRLPYLNYGCTLARLDRHNEAEAVARFLYKNNEKSDFLLDDIANIYYLTENYKEVVKLYKECQYSFSADLLQFYLYALIKCGEEQLAYELIDESIENNKSQIIDCEQDDEFDESERMNLIGYVEVENTQLEELMENLKNGIKPHMEFEPHLEIGCYLFGCYRHNNPDLDS